MISRTGVGEKSIVAISYIHVQGRVELVSLEEVYGRRAQDKYKGNIWRGSICGGSRGKDYIIIIIYS